MGFSITRLLYLLFFYPCLLALSTHNIHTDHEALLAFKRGILDNSYGILSNWDRHHPVCNWTGVSCKHHRVTMLNLKRSNLSGTISPSLSNLSRLTTLDISENHLNGRIPSELGLLSKLSMLDLHGNQLVGHIPATLSQLSGLVFLNLGGNLLVGQFPMTLLQNCSTLFVLDLSENKFSGEIPPEIGNWLPNIEDLFLYSNQFSGNIPSSLGNCSNLSSLDLEYNHLNGELPFEIVQRLPKMEYLHLAHNNLVSHDNNTNLRPFFVSLSNCSGLLELELQGNILGGEIPDDIGQLLPISLLQLQLQENRIHGRIPPNIANLYNLTLLNLSANFLNGTIPQEISLLSNLQRLVLSKNLLEGNIPASLGNLDRLGELDLAENKLSGEIPASLSKLSQLRRLFLQWNSFSGRIPPSLGRCIRLELVDLSHNMLTGPIPFEFVAGLHNLFFYFNLSHNFLNGSIPLELSKLDKVIALSLSSNNFSGSIPSQIGSCVGAESINLSHNSLQGPIPEALGGLWNVRILDLSFNHLCGEIPESLERCTALSLLNLSFNELSGPVPSSGPFTYFSNSSFSGNPNLCGSFSGMSPCQNKKKHKSHHIKAFFLVIAIVSSTLFLLTVTSVCLSMALKTVGPTTTEHSTPIDIKSKYPRISYRELEEATNGFDNERLIGSGGFGQVYKGVMKDGTEAAIKVLNLQGGNSTKSFLRECEVLKKIRHRNLMRIITACSLPDFKALVLPFMANGSLESYLYGPNGGLGLGQVISICSDMAEGVAYLHHHAPVRVIHCDLKPSNVLLNEEMMAMVSDFGIARLVMRVAGDGSVAGGEAAVENTADVFCGSIGYIAPEYGFGRSPSVKGDVYSFGTMVLQIVTGKRPTDEMFAGGSSLQRWVRNHYPRHIDKVLNSRLACATMDQSPEVKKMWDCAILEIVELGLLCTQETPSTRPSMLDVADDLDRLKGYLAGDTTATFASSLGISSSTITGDDDD
ncbi:putative leucine-rich repeat receptor-like serine/threonine-protein kinase At2g24130 [Amborella trichopoda]|uniref:non-specific serine/threonine protein kinase n=1 Tax=Amborella trichopoda TaxID=13333 RepID=U5CYU5_AMBTC|nr:putative leucine-rich repeat receptor-like serine/threonine-protein kinase At2g24130 [Amborella trichopoda]ERN18506.1 hypothetical protein AMTR_s00065p00026770 [Amborella trichopoda]|eukprot:XP_006857039.1 putative leucine-rich repeat receptor-like serine/threonine-protein kinase At2g24130 [Amborella trichopoda]